LGLLLSISSSFAILSSDDFSTISSHSSRITLPYFSLYLVCLGVLDELVNYMGMVIPSIPSEFNLELFLSFDDFDIVLIVLLFLLFI